MAQGVILQHSICIKDVIENRILLDYNIIHKDRGYDSAVIAAPTEIAGERYICQVVIKRSKKKNRFYLHEVTLQKNLLDDAFVTNLAQKPASQGDLAKVLQNIITTSDNASKIVDSNGEPHVVYHQTNAVAYVNVETGQEWDDLSWR